MSNYKIVKALKQSNEDFEYYPTTEKILDEVCLLVKKNIDSHHMNSFSILDVGAGTGKVLDYFHDKDLLSRGFAIEKSPMLASVINQKYFLMGADFWEQSFIDKDVDMIFCNPPYSEFSCWMKKIIYETIAKTVCFVVPSRWKDNLEVQSLIKDAKFKVETIEGLDFIDAEDRKARCNVEVVMLTKDRYSKENNALVWDGLFDGWMEDNSKELSDEDILGDSYDEIVLGNDTISMLVMLYEEEFKKMQEGYEAILKIDSILLKEVGINKEVIIGGIKSKTNNLKIKYWKRAMDEVSSIDKRLTNSYKSKIFGEMFTNTSCDFNYNNIVMVATWLCKNVNKSIDDQLVDFYKDLMTSANVEAYKSNSKFFVDDYRGKYPKHSFYWDFEEGSIGKVKLANRIVLENRGRNSSPLDYYDNRRHLTLIKDIYVIASNLGFRASKDALDGFIAEEWYGGKKQTLALEDGVILFECKSFLNRNVHIKFNHKFIDALNVEFGRLEGWICNAKEAKEELGSSFGYDVLKNSKIDTKLLLSI